MEAWSEGSQGSISEPSSISSTLLGQVRARQPEPWQRLVEVYGPVVYHWCRRLGVATADIVQEVFGAVAARLGQFRRDGPRDSFGAWLRTITRNKAHDYFRQRQGQSVAEGGTDAYRQLLNLPQCPDQSTSSYNSLETDGLLVHRILDVVLAEFESRTWEAFWRIVVEGQSPSEAAAALTLSLPAVYQAKSRVLRRLRQERNNLLE